MSKFKLKVQMGPSLAAVKKGFGNSRESLKENKNIVLKDGQTSLKMSGLKNLFV